MADDDKKALYRRIAAANPHMVLDRMRAHGFWPAGQGLPPDPPDEAKERKAIEAELENLRRAGGGGGEAAVEAALRDERKRRWEESKKRRAEKKKLREARRSERRAAWAKTRAATMVHAGEGVSAGLTDQASDVALLEQRGLPVVSTPEALAAAMGIPIAQLRWLTYHRAGVALVHYHRYGIPKKTGGIRAISAPKPKLAQAQRWVQDHVLAKLATEEPAHGFVRGRSIVSNAEPHVAKKVVVNVDLENFFPTLTMRRVKGLFQAFGYSGAVATCLALLCTEPPRAKVVVDGAPTRVAIGERALPQGACTSPAITNLACRRLDRRLAGLAAKLGFAYTRYADDLTFSSPDGDKAGLLLHRVRRVLADEGFREHPAKTHVMRSGRRQEVTGVVVNARTGVSRAEVRTLRAILHNAAKHGLASQNRDDHPAFAAYLRGRVAFVTMVDPAKKDELRAALARALAAG